LATAIKTENLSKIYRLGEIGTGTISRDLERWWARMRGKEDPFLKIGQANDRAVKGDSDIVYSLRDINFEIQQGEAVGIIGKNGAGKSTLLKILSRVTSPTTGKIDIKGRIASLLEVGTGFHPELTGRENIYLNGAILGMRKKEITRKLDEIIDFSGVERYIDTPVKRYSSGMYVRLAFAVAAHLESEILIVDEVLAVGDAEFQKKCLGKMGDISKGEGRTILFVSHNLSAISNLCNKGIFLKEGAISSIGNINKVTENYLGDLNGDKNGVLKINSDEFIFLGINNLNDFLNFSITSILKIDLKFQVLNFQSDNVFFDIGVFNSIGVMVIHSKSVNFKKPFKVSPDSEFILECIIKNHNLAPGDYSVTLYVYSESFIHERLVWVENIPLLTVSNKNVYLETNDYINFKDVKSLTLPQAEFQIL
jgi:lipopolysaccharide transport system ATP-binding protein